MNDNELKKALLDEAVLHGEFTLSSGRSSSYYIDKYRFETRPDLLAAIVDRLAGILDDQFPTIDQFAVPALGAVPLGAPLSIKTGVSYLIVRKKEKEYGTGSQIEGTFKPGQNVVIVEDIVTTGGEAIRSLRSLREEDLKVSGVVCVVNRQEGGEENLAEQNATLHSLFTSTELGLKSET